MGGGASGSSKRKAGARAGLGADRDGPAVRLHDGPHQAQAEAQARLRPAAVAPVEPIEDPGLLVRRDARAVIPGLDRHPAGRAEA